MTDNSRGGAVPPIPRSGSAQEEVHETPQFGVAGVLRESLSVYSKSFVPISLMVLLASVIGYGLEFLVTFAFVGGTGPTAATWVLIVAMYVKSFMIFSLATGFVVQIAFVAKTGGSISKVAVIRNVIARIVPLFIVSVAASGLIVLGLMALVLPGLYLAGMLAVYVPAIVIEKRGYAALRRSANLTKGYRWPVVGLLVIVYIMLIVVAGITAGLVEGLVDSVGVGPAFIVAALIEVLPNAILSVVTAMIYARLLELKEGVGVEDIAKIFE